MKKKGPIPYIYKGPPPLTDWGPRKKKCTHSSVAARWHYGSEFDRQLRKTVYIKWRKCECGHEERKTSFDPYKFSAVYDCDDRLK